MADNYSTKSVLVADNGIFACLAETLAASFGKVFYHSPWVSAFPSSRQTELGEGFADFERVDDIWEIIDDVDLFVFPDLYQGPLQEYLVSLGKRVFGSRNGDELENDRTQAKAHFKGLGIPQVSYKVVKGMEALRKYIQENDKEKLWIKINRTRGDTETFCVEGYDLGKNRLDKLESELGPVAEHMDFIVENNLDFLDVALDTHAIDGKYPSVGMFGMEEKDEAYVCAVKNWDDLPSELTDIYDKLSDTLHKFQYRNFFSLECRATEKKMFMGDPCTRVGSPVFELQLYMIQNLAEILWHGAAGELVEPKYSAKFGFEVLIRSDWAMKNPLLVEVPKAFRKQVKFHYASRFDGQIWIMPQRGNDTIGSIVTTGDHIYDCFSEAEKISDQIKGTGIKTCISAIPSVKKNIDHLQEWGVDMVGKGIILQP